jgi:hypothetical protein
MCHFAGVELPGHRDIVEPRIRYCDEAAGRIDDPRVPQRGREHPAVVQERARPGLRDRADPVGDLAEHLARNAGAALHPGLELAHELRRRRAAALHDLGDGGVHEIAFAAATGVIEHRTGQRSERPAARLGLREPVGALHECQAVAHAPPVRGREHVHRPARRGDALHAVQLQRVEPGDDGTRPRVEEGAPPAVVAASGAVVERDDAGCERLPGATGTAPLRDRGAAQAEAFKVADANHGGAAQRGDAVRWEIEDATRHAARVAAAGAEQVRSG